MPESLIAEAEASMKTVMSGVTAIANAVVMGAERPPAQPRTKRVRHRSKVTPTPEEIILIEATRTCPELIAELQESVRKRHRSKSQPTAADQAAAAAAEIEAARMAQAGQGAPAGQPNGGGAAPGGPSSS